MITQVAADELFAQLESYIGSGGLTRFIGRTAITDGVRFLIETTDAFWLATAIVSHRHDPVVSAEPVQYWTLTRKGKGAVLVMTDGNYREVMRQEIAFTDFPLPAITLLFVDNVLMLPGEY